MVEGILPCIYMTMGNRYSNCKHLYLRIITIKKNSKNYF